MLLIREGEFTDVIILVSMWDAMDSHVVNSTENTYLSQRVEGYNAEVEKTLNETIENGNSTIFVAEDNEAIVGFISAHVERLPWFSPSTGLLGACWVDNEYRKRGIGRKLVHNAERWLTGKNVHSIQVCWDYGNLEADAFWTRNGYAISQFRGTKS